MSDVFNFLDTVRGITIAIIQLAFAVSGMLCIWLAQNIWNVEGWGWCTVMTHHDKGEFDKAEHHAAHARRVFHWGWVVAGSGMIMIFLAGVVR